MPSPASFTPDVFPAFAPAPAPNSAPAPAAAPPSNPPVDLPRTLPSPPVSAPVPRLGRIRIISLKGITLGYVTGRESGSGNFSYCATKIVNALIVSFIPSHERHTILVVNAADDENTHLAVRWPGLKSRDWSLNVKNVAELATMGPDDPTSQPLGACQDLIWNVLPDGTVAANYPSDDRVTHTLVPIVELESYALRLVRDADGYIKKKSRLMDFGKERFTKCHFTFEDL
ncbi:hypothetical protein M407DRAFT_158177 [Tulasnella calospora MUT 4182]|uniref:Uncharacterized protein n=1 Tax=Tulasnella calospora MUT 4182 TaxID=1051891 RepID=A0A0C3QPC1_9AGAM|nr:hypothetical protein M407DRAFT_158177 [Tulasnella calospora MUT 4182]